MKLSRVDLLVLVGLASVILFFVSKLCGDGRLIKREHECRLNLRNIWPVYMAFTADHGGKPVSEVSTNAGGTLEVRNDPAQFYRHFQTLYAFPGASPQTLLCPADTRTAAARIEDLGNSNISYFLSLDPKFEPNWLLMGDRNIARTDGIVEIQGARWYPEVGLHGSSGYVLFGDGRISRLGSNDLLKAARNQKGTNVVGIP